MANRKHVVLFKRGVAALNAPSCRRRLTSAGRTPMERTYSGFWRQRPGRRPMRWRWRPLKYRWVRPLIYPHDVSLRQWIRPARTLKAGLYVVRYIDFLKKNVGYIPSVKYGHTP